MTVISNPASPRARPAVRAIAERLREMFDSVAAGPMPEHLLNLVDQLEAAYHLDQGRVAEATAAPIPD